MSEKVEIRFREPNLKNKWDNANNKVPVNPQYVFETKEREDSFYANQFLTKEEKKDLENIVRNGIEGKEFDCVTSLCLLPVRLVSM